MGVIGLALVLDLLLDLSDLSRSAVAKLLRALWWLGWDFCIRTVGWSIGWVFLRAITLGRFPKEEIDHLDNAPWFLGLLVEILGLVLLAASIFAVSNTWPLV